MTREEILAMDASELRVEVAEKIFHAKVIGKAESNPPEFLLVGDKGNGLVPLSGKRWTNTTWHFSEESAWNDCPEYGESISAAWEVVEKFQWIVVKKFITVGNDVRFYAYFEDNEYQEVRPESYAICKSAPEAICKAALLAVMEVSE